MASIETRVNKLSTTHRVVWREQGDKQNETFGDLKSAEDFKVLVEASGHRWPRGWTPGVGFTDVKVDLVPTFSEWSLKAIAARSTADDRTRHEYLRDFRNHLEPTVGHLRLDEISRDDHVGPWVIAKRSQRSDKTVKNLHSLASSIINDAIATGRFGLETNPFHRALPRDLGADAEEMIFLRKSEFDALYAGIRADYQPLVYLLAMSGLRWSEATALTVADIRIGARRATVTVNKAWKWRPAEHRHILGPPKTKRSRRTIAINNETVEVITPLIESRSPRARLFTSAQGQSVHHSNFRLRIWRKAIDTAIDQGDLEVRPRIHDLRHTHASWLIEQGVDLLTIQRRLGHDSIETTVGRYGHLRHDVDDRVVAALDDLGGVRPTQSGPLVPVGIAS